MAVLPDPVVTALDSVRDLGSTISAAARFSVPGAEFGVSEDRVARAQTFANRIGVRLVVDGKNGWRTQRFVKTFQDAFQLNGTTLVVDGLPGGKTEQAMNRCEAAGYLLAPNFRCQEFLTKGARVVDSQNYVWRVSREHVAALQRLRDLIKRPLYLISTYRDPAHNRAVGGATNSQHLYGLASDIDRPRTSRPITEAEARSCGFRGVGMAAAARPGLDVIHVDVRSTDARWYYA